MTTEQQGDGPWSPAFPGQRPPFPDGNAVAVRHGAYSPAIVDPRAEQLVELVLSDPATSYLRQPSYAATLHSWSVAQARADVFGAWLFEKPVEEQIRPPRGGAKSPLEVWLSLTRTAVTLADRLGLTPLSRARLGRDVAVAEVAEASLERMAEEGQRALEGRPDFEVVEPDPAPAVTGKRAPAKGPARRARRRGRA